MDRSRANTEIRTRDFELVAWQTAACDAWETGAGEPYSGTLEVFTGGGKTLIALEAISRASRLEQDLRIAIVVPTVALAHQWIDNVVRFTSLSRAQVGLLGAGETASFVQHQLIVSVINTAAKELPGLAVDDHRMMLVVDECHRAGAPTFARVLDTRARFRLGLSATPDREEYDDAGEPLEYDAQLVGQLLGSVVYRFSLRDAREVGWLPDYEIHHHGVDLSPEERSEYEAATRRIDDLTDRLGEFGLQTWQARAAAGRPGDLGQVASAYVAATARRKDLLYRAVERGRIAPLIVKKELADNPQARILMFHERIDEADALFGLLNDRLEAVEVAIEHSRLSRKIRNASIEAFRQEEISVLVSVKSLVEGIDVPSADVGISAAASSSVRQRIQSLGRVLRRQFDEARGPKRSRMHLLYVSDSADESIYECENWAELTGEGNDFYWRWDLDEPHPRESDTPPRAPKPTEEEEWQRLRAEALTLPADWLGAIPRQEFTVDTRGNVRTAQGTFITNGQGVGDMVKAVRGQPGGRFYVTNTHRLVIVPRGGQEGGLSVAGKLDEPFALRREPSSESLTADSPLEPGAPYAGPADKTNGSYKLSKKRGGVIERKLKGGITEFAVLSASNNSELQANGVAVLSNWKQLALPGMSFHVNTLWHAWFANGGEVCFLGCVPGGFCWPSTTCGEEQ